jgi:signal transduction histidine kinase
VLTVENTGQKLTPQSVATLAEPFLRGTKRIRTDHAGVGVGLGLAIVKSITQAHDGTLTLTPRAAGGLRVTVQLPRGVRQQANGLGTGPGDGYRAPQGRRGHLEEEVDKSPEGA